MRNYSKVGGKIGKPGYRTPSMFRAKVLAVVSQIPKGKTLTYKQVAEKVGSPNASRAVGSIMSQNFDPNVPCHRVVRSDGKVGNYNRGGAEVKARMLAKEKLENGR